MVSQAKPYIAVSVTQYFQYTDPHSVPLNAPSPAIDPDAGAEPISNLAEWPTLAATTWDVGGTTFSISADLNQVVSRFGAGAYRVIVSTRSAPTTASGGEGNYTVVIGAEARILFSYCIFVK